MMDLNEIVKAKGLYPPARINLLLKKLNLKPVIPPEKFILKTKGIKHRYYSPCLNNGKKYFFYALLRKKSREKFLRELRLAKFLIKRTPKNLLPYLPNYIKISSLKSQPPWIVVDFIDKPVLEDKKNAEVSIRKLTKKENEVLTKIILKINHSLKSKEARKELKIKKFNLKEARQKVFSNLGILKNRGFNQEKIDQIKKNFESDIILWNKENNYFCHGDLHLGNIVYIKNNSEVNFKIIDWELYHINNFAYDISFFFSRLWRERKIRNDLIKNYLSFLPKNKIIVFTKLFKVTLVYFAITYGLNSSPLEFTKEQVLKRQMWFKRLVDLYLEDFGKYLKL